MKNKLSCLLVLTSLLGLGLISNQQNHEDLIDYNYDALSTNVKRYALSEMRTSSGVETSKIYVQTATKDNEYYLRFATAIKGDVTSIKYTRELIGIEETETVKTIKSSEITTLYKGISSGEEISYFSGSQELIDQEITSTKDYYWACYTIKFSSDSSYLATNIKMTLSVNDEEVKTRTTSLNENLNNSTMSDDLVGYLEAVENYDITLNKVSDKIQSNEFKIPQGGCTDGNNLYYALNKMGSAETKLVKYNLFTKETLYSNVITLCSGNEFVQTPGKTFFYNNMIGLILKDGTIKFFDTNTLSEITDEKLTFTGDLKAEYIYDISYNEKQNKFALIDKAGNLYFANKDLVTYSSGTKISVDGDLNDIYSDEKYIYALGGSNNVIGGTISIYDWLGNVIKEKVSFNDTDNKTGITLDSEVNAQSIVKLNDKYYCAINRFNSDGLLICELEFNNNVNKSNLNLNFIDSMEYIEKTNKNISEVKYQQLFKYSGRQSRGAFVDGDYMYFSFTNSGATDTILVKYNSKTNRIENETEAFEINTEKTYVQTKGSIFVYNDNVYVCVKENKFKVFDENLNALNDGNEVTLFENFPETIVDVEYNKTEDKFAIIGANTLYIYDSNKKKITKTDVTGSFYSSSILEKDERLNLQDVTSTDKYIYTLSNKDGVLGGGISIFDWSGNQCDTLTETYNDKAYKSLIIHDAANTCATSDGKYNGQSIFIKDNELYFVALNYGAGSGSFVFKTSFVFDK